MGKENKEFRQYRAIVDSTLADITKLTLILMKRVNRVEKELEKISEIIILEDQKFE